MSTSPEEIRVGVYQHYKGRHYQVLGKATHSETEEPLVVYRQLYGDFSLWVRPKEMFQESVDGPDGTMPRFAYARRRREPALLALEAQERAVAYIQAHGRDLEKSLLAYHFEEGAAEPVFTALSRFQNADGGFGHGLEPDVQAPDSSVLATTQALQICRKLGASADHSLTRGAMAYLMTTYDAGLVRWPFLPPAAEDHPHAPWWNQATLERNFDRFLGNPRAEIVGYLFDYPDSSSPSLRHQLLDTVIDYLDEIQPDLSLNTFLCYRHLLETANLPADVRADLASRLESVAEHIVVIEPEQWSGYVMTPVDAADRPDSIFARIFPDALSLYLDYLIEQQAPSGAWKPPWQWGSAFPDVWPDAERDWCGILTLENLLLFQHFDRLATEN